jgi:uncharacterized membrane protein
MARIYGIVAAVAVIAVIALILMAGRSDAPAAATQSVATGGNVEIPLQELAGGEAKFFTHDVNGVAVKYFVLKSPDGEYRAALDASQECAKFKKGFRQEGNDLVCNECGQKFASVSINVSDGACNPLSIDRKVKGKNLILKVADLQSGVQYFQ